MLHEGVGPWTDVSVALVDGMVCWPGNPPVTIYRQMDRDRGDPCNVSALSLDAHSGTRVDAPRALCRRGLGRGRPGPRGGHGPGADRGSGRPHLDQADLVRHLDLGRDERVLFKTANSPRACQRDGFDEHAVYLEGLDLSEVRGATSSAVCRCSSRLRRLPGPGPSSGRCPPPRGAEHGRLAGAGGEAAPPAHGRLTS
jgi:hypothetical protein